MSFDLRTDDRGRRNEYIYRGPATMPFMWRARLSTQIYTLILAVILWLVLGMVVPSVLFLWVPYVPAFLVKVAFVAVAGMFGAVAVAKVVGPKITKDRPLRYWFRVLSAELNAPREGFHRTRHAPVAPRRGLWSDTGRKPIAPTASPFTGKK